jgi:hypothetical protein
MILGIVKNVNQFWTKLLIINFLNLVVRIKFYEQNIGNIYFLDHLMKQNIINVAPYGGPQIKVSFQILNLQMVIC